MKNTKSQKRQAKKPSLLGKTLVITLVAFVIVALSQHRSLLELGTLVGGLLVLGTLWLLSNKN